MENKKEFEYLNVLHAIEQIPFGVGRNLLIDFLHGNKLNESIRKNFLHEIKIFGELGMYERDEIDVIIDKLISYGMIEQKPLTWNPYAKILCLTEKGRAESINPRLAEKINPQKNIVLNISDEELVAFKSFDFFLKEFNNEQKKAIISKNNRILCIAGAGSGKTSVLTKRIEFLLSFKSINAEKILAITFTRKARAEMITRLSNSQICNGVSIETFNSFCEKILYKYNDFLYSKKMRVIGYNDKLRLINSALNYHNISIQSAIAKYFTQGEMRGKTNEELMGIFTNDCFFVLDYCKNYNKKIEDAFSKQKIINNKAMVEMVYRICRHIQKLMNEFGLRDYSDQIVECIRLFNTYKETIPKYEHILVDEYQDINYVQAVIIDILNPPNIFCVGDPRQSIFGWRGSKISYITNFRDKYEESEIIPLSTNYRSVHSIVELMNQIIVPMRLPNLYPSSNDDGEIRFFEFENEESEMEFVIQTILNKSNEFNTIFVLARTNRIIVEISDRMRLRGIAHSVRTEEVKRNIENNSTITLATVHSIKGMEADTVFVIGATPYNFPCRASEHPILEMIRIDDYDKEEEERRLFYVAISRAKKRLYLSYTKNLTKFINERIKSTILVNSGNGIISNYINNKIENKETDLMGELMRWRNMTAEELGVPAYMVMHNKTLLEIAMMKPCCKEDLTNIYGLGDSKINRYGEEILRIVAKREPCH